MRPFLVAAALVCTAVIAPVAAQIPLPAAMAKGNLWLGGSVVDSVSGEPVRFALVNLTLNASRPGAWLYKNMLADASGRFRFAELPAGEFQVVASKPRYESSRSSEIRVTLDRSREDAVVRLTPYAGLTGKVTDGAGEPLAGVTVQAFRSAVSEGRRKTELSTWASTDDRGEYRMSYLSGGGIYAVRAAGRESAWMHLTERTPGAPADEAFAPVYYGGGATAGLATLIPLQAGQEFRADFKLTLLPAHRIRGVVKNLAPYKAAQIELVSGEDDASATRVAINIATGKFEVQEVVDGTYRIRVTQHVGEHRLRAIETVQVAGQDVDGVVLALSEGGALLGTMRVEGPKQERLDTKPQLIAVDDPPLRGIPPRNIWSTVGPDGRVRFDAVTPGKYQFRFMVYGNALYVDSARLGEQDLLATSEFTVGTAPPGELEIVLRTDGGSIAARVPDEPGVIGILVSESGERRPMISGAYRGSLDFRSVPPGAYLVSAWRNGEHLEYLRPDILQLLRTRGERVEVLAGRPAKVDVLQVQEAPQ